MLSGPREIVTPFRQIPLEVPEGMKPNEFFNSTENLNDLVHNNGLLQNPEGLLLYRKALGHSNEFDTSIIYNTSRAILDPLGRPVRRTQVPEQVKNVWNRMNEVILSYMLEQYPDPDETLVLAGEASLDATWPLTSPGVPSIRMLHNHFIVFSKAELRDAPLADTSITDNGGDARFDVYLVDFGGNGDGAFQLDNCGLLNPDQCAGYMLQENDFAGYGYNSQREAIRVLGSHEFFHAVQAAYDVDQGSVLSEGTAVWATETFDPTLTDFEWLISGYFENPDHPLNLPLSGPVDTFSYGSAIFFEFLTEQVGNTAVRTLWERVENGARGIDNPTWFEVLPSLLEDPYNTRFSEVFHSFARFNLYTDSHADAVASYPEGADFPALAMVEEAAPYQDALFRVSYAASKYLTVSAGGRSNMTAALVGTAEELADLALFLAVDNGANYTQVVQLSDLKAGSESVEMNGARHLVVGVANGSLGPISRKPALCVGTPVEVASCRAAFSPVDPVEATPVAKAHNSGCQVVSPTPLAMMLGLLLCHSACRRKFPARTTRQ